MTVLRIVRSTQVTVTIPLTTIAIGFFPETVLPPDFVTFWNNTHLLYVRDVPILTHAFLFVRTGVDVADDLPPAVQMMVFDGEILSTVEAFNLMMRHADVLLEGRGTTKCIDPTSLNVPVNEYVMQGYWIRTRPLWPNPAAAVHWAELGADA